MTYAANAGWGGTGATWLRAGVALGYVLAFGALVLRLSTQSHFDPLKYRRRFALLFSPKIVAMQPPGDDEESWADPAAAKVTDPVMWRVHSIVHRLRRIHFAAGQLVVTLVLAAIDRSPVMSRVAMVGLAITVVLVVLTSYFPKDRVVLAVTAWITILAEAAAIAAVAVFTLSESVLHAAALEPFAFLGDGILDINAIHRTTFHIAIALGVFAGLSIVAGIAGVGALTFATFLGGAFGVGVGLVSEDLLSVGEHLVAQGGAWVAPASLIFVLFLAVVAIGLTFGGTPELRAEGLTNRLLTRITHRSRILLGAAAGFGLVAGSTAIVGGCFIKEVGCQPAALRGVSNADFVVVVLLVAVAAALGSRLWRHRKGAAVASLLLAGVLAWIGLAEPELGRFAPANYLKALPLSRSVIFVAPVLAIGRSVLGAYRQGASSRKVGVLWDVASFWPRWFHPLAPPAYGPKVVTSLREHLEKGETDVLAAHSQGSVIAAVATFHASRSAGAGLSGLLTYGSPIGLLYGNLFPDSGMRALITDLPANLPKGWSNLWREDDPIGGVPLGGTVADVVESDGSGHSGYELTRAYRAQRDKLV